MVFAGLGWVRSSAVEWAFLVVDSLIGRGGEAVDLCDLQLLGHLRAYVERICVVVCIGIIE